MARRLLPLCALGLLAVYLLTRPPREPRRAATGRIAAMEQPPPKSYRCRRSPHAIAVTGRGDDPAWAAADWTDDFVDIEGDERPTPRFRTRAKMLWDDKFFYVFAQMDEPHVWGTITRRNAVIFHDNDFEVFIDPDGDGANYYEFEMNALNTVWELTLPVRYSRGGKPVDPSPLPGLASAVHVDGTLNDPADVDRGWSVEVAFPFAALAAYNPGRATPPNPGDAWRVNFSRVEWQHTVDGGRYAKRPGVKEDNWVWSPQGVVDMHQPEHWGFVRFEG